MEGIGCKETGCPVSLRTGKSSFGHYAEVCSPEVEQAGYN